MLILTFLVVFVNLFESLGLCAEKFLEIPYSEAQDDDWSCGPNSAARLMKFYGDSISYGKLKRAMRGCVGIGINVGDFCLNSNATGPIPSSLANQMTEHSTEKFRYVAKETGSLRDLKNLIESNNPVIALIAFKDTALLHYILINGFSDAEGKIYFVDTNGQQKNYTYSKFMMVWDSDFLGLTTVVGAGRRSFIIKSGSQNCIERVVTTVSRSQPSLNVGPVTISPGSVMTGFARHSIIGTTVEGIVRERPALDIASDLARTFVPGVAAVESFARGDVLDGCVNLIPGVPKVRRMTDGACSIQ